MTLKLYWVVTDDHCEDWFIVAETNRQAATFHEQNEGYLPGDARAEEVTVIPDGVNAETGWPSDAVLVAAGAEFVDQGPARVVRICGKTFCEGLLEATLRSIDDDRSQAAGEQRLNGTPATTKEVH